jgi:hypothetical protein
VDHIPITRPSSRGISILFLGLGSHLQEKLPSLSQLTSIHADFPVINPTLLSKPCRYAFCATMDDDVRTPNFDGIAKFDLTTKDGTDAVVGRITYPPGVLGGEAVYVPRVQTGAPTPEGRAIPVSVTITTASVTIPVSVPISASVIISAPVNISASFNDVTISVSVTITGSVCAMRTGGGANSSR